MSDNPLAAFRGNGVGLPSREQMGQFLNTAAMAAPAGSGGKQFLKISDKDGVWTFGAEETVVEEDSLWAINPLSMFHGYVAWFDGKPEGEHRQPITRPLMPSDSLSPVKALRGWEKQFGFDLVCVSGEDEGTLCEYKASSVGGTRAFSMLVAALNAQFATDPDRVIPVVQLRDNKYYDKKYKKDQFPPVFQIVEWRAMDDASAPKTPEPEPEPEGRRRTRPAAAPVEEMEPLEQQTVAYKQAAADEEAALAREYAATQQAEAATPRRRVRR